LRESKHKNMSAFTNAGTTRNGNEFASVSSPQQQQRHGAGGGGGGEQEGEIVKFKIMRSRRPKVALGSPLFFCSSSSSSEKDDDDLCFLQLREEFGSVALGETVRLLVSAQNERRTSSSSRMATKMRIRIEVLVNAPQAHVARGKQASFVLLDETARSADEGGAVLKPSESHDVEVQFDAKQLGQHTLRCTAEYVDAPYDERSATTIMNVAGENTVYDVGVRKTTVNYFSFNVTNPLHVRTKTRRVFSSSSSSSSGSSNSTSESSNSGSKEKVFLEATIENVDKTAARLITKVHLIVDEKRHKSTPMFPEISDEETLFDVGNNKNQIYLQKGGGAAHFLFELEETDEWRTSSLTTNSAPTSASGKDELGTLEICWLGSTGEPGRLQTQPILAPKPSDTTPPQIMRGGNEYGRPILKTTMEILNNEGDENVAKNIVAAIDRAVPEKITAVTAERPFLVRVKVSNLSQTTDSGPVELRIEDDATSNNNNTAKTQNSSNDTVNALLSHSGTIRVNGESVKTLQDIPKNNGFREVLFEMVALAPGVKKLPQITVRELSGRIVLSPAAREVYVLAP
jgi:hypothetical protein